MCRVPRLARARRSDALKRRARAAGRQRRADAAEAFFQPLAGGDFGLDADEEELGRPPPPVLS